jgi:DNA-directed RNA polymerase subunit RPC12/RpoP
MKCLNCGEEILADNAKVCPYCGSKNLETEAVQVIDILKCPLCGSEMNCNEVKIRMVGSQGLKEILGFTFFTSENVGGEIILPLLMHVCSNCGKIEFMAKGKKTQRILNKS